MFVEKHPDESVKLMTKIVEHFGEYGTIVGGYLSQTHAVLGVLAKKNPDAIWREITKYLGPPKTAHAFRLTRWLRGDTFGSRGSGGGLSLIPAEQVWTWVNEDAAKRALYLATFVPTGLFREEGRICFAREVLVRYGSRKDVRDMLIGNFSSEGWSGPASSHYAGRRQWLLEFCKDETNESVRRWIGEYVAVLDAWIEGARIDEERQF